MKPHLPKLLLAALLGVGACYSYSAELTEQLDDDGYAHYGDKHLTLNSRIELPSKPEYLYGEPSVEWSTSDGGTLSGNGAFGMVDTSSLKTADFDISTGSHSEDAATVTIEKGVTLRNVYMTVWDNTKVVCKNSFHNVIFDGRTFDLTDATITGYVGYNMESGCRIIRPTIEFSSCPGTICTYREYDYYGGVGPYIEPVIEGNVVLNGNGVVFDNKEICLDAAKWDTGAYGYIRSMTYLYYDREYGADDFGGFVITGSLTIQSRTAVVFYEEGDGGYVDGVDPVKGEYEFGSWTGKYSEPGASTRLILCSRVDGSLGNLIPYSFRDDNVTETYYFETGEVILTGALYVKPLNGYYFYSKAEADGMVGIYLAQGAGGSGGSQTPVVPPTPSIPETSIVVGAGDTVILGKDEDTTPGKDKPLYIQGGIADGSGLAGELLNNKVIQGTCGTLKTGSDQKMEITGSGSLKYSIVGADDKASGADLDIKLNGQLELQGKQYNTAKTTISGGVLSINSGSSLGMGTGKTAIEVKSGASLTNFGKVAGDVTLAEGSTMLNQNKVEGDVLLQGKSTMVNNGAVSGTVTVGSGALLSGTGTAGAAVLRSGASMHVGNSPGYQKYGSLTIDRGASISFTVDGTQAATLDRIGEGTHSVLQTDSLTINDGEGKVALDVEVTLGIAAAGAAPIEVTLADAVDGNATAADFSINLEDNGLLEEGAELTWDAASQTLVLSGSVSKAALAALMDSNSANVANTMWASANAVQEMARTAEGQSIIGMPGQTTWWGAGMGSFMDISGGQGFTSNAGGFAVGIQHAFTESFRFGVALGGMFGDFRSDDKQLKVQQESVLPVLTAQYVTALDTTSSLTVSGHIAYGEVSNDADTYQAGTVGSAKWDDSVLNIGVRTSWNKQLTDDSSVSFFSGLTYQSVEQDSFTEKFTGGSRDYRSGSMSSLSLPLGVTLRGVYGMGGTNIFVPEVTVAYIRDIARDNPEVKTSVYGFNRVGKGTNIGRDAFMLNAGANWMFDSSWSVGAFYTLEARSSQVNQSVNASLRYCF